jgi:hypothetical protein
MVADVTTTTTTTIAVNDTPLIQQQGRGSGQPRSVRTVVAAAGLSDEAAGLRHLASTNRPAPET